MKLVIDYNHLKREINGEFMICADGDTLRAIADSINEKLKGDPKYYGWLDIRMPRTPLSATPNQPPIDWGAAP